MPKFYWPIAARLFAAAATGAGAPSIAAAFGMAAARVEQLAAKECVCLTAVAPACPELHHRLIAIFLSIPTVQVPRWVPHDFAEEYLEVAAEQGEEAAASAMRRLKREMLAA